MSKQSIKSTLHHSLRDIVELTSARYKHFTDKLVNRELKVKLVAVAQDEAAYLPEWIAHHLHFGFDEIEIHINGTTDNSLEVIEPFLSMPNVSVVNADDFFKSYPGNPQVGTYKNAYAKAVKQGFSHLCFIDIDEYWVPADLTTTIQDCIKNLGKADVYSFEWCNKYEPDNIFGYAVEQSFWVQRALQVKSIIDAKTPVYRVNTHTVINPYLNYKLADGSKFNHTSEGYSRIDNYELNKPVKPYFIVHRFYRSTKEYISILGKKRLTFPKQGISEVKSNRKGYASPENLTKITFDEHAYSVYRNAMNKFIEQYTNPVSLIRAQESVDARYYRVLDIIQNSERSQAAVLEKVLRNVSDPAVLEAYKLFRKTHAL